MTGPLAVRRRSVTVTALDAATTSATVQWPDAATTTAGVPYLSSYLPAVGDIALIDLVAGSPVLVGTVGPRRVEARLARSAQAVGSGGGGTIVSWGSVLADPYGLAATNPTITIPDGYGGEWLICFQTVGIFGGRSFVQLTVTSAVTGTPTLFRVPADAANSNAVITVPLLLVAGDTFSALIFQTSGVSQNFTSWLNAVRLC
jgi:hypothetical protein